MPDVLLIHEMFRSVQGESTWAGLPCVFVRLTGCPLRCSYCDTAYAFSGGQRWSVEGLRTEIGRLAAPYPSGIATGRLPLVELTGGEPLLQPGVMVLMTLLCDDGFTVLLETSGALDISRVDPRVHRIMDLKCPSSGESERNEWANVHRLRGTDEVKFVIGTVEDYDWARHVVRDRELARRCVVLFSWAHPVAPGPEAPALRPVPAGHHPLTQLELVERILADALPVRFQVQIHKVIWPADRRGV